MPKKTETKNTIQVEDMSDNDAIAFTFPKTPVASIQDAYEATETAGTGELAPAPSLKGYDVPCKFINGVFIVE